MAIFGARHTPTMIERIRQAAGWALALTFAAGWVFVTNESDAPRDGIGDAASFLMLPAFAVIWLLSLRKVVGWMEWRRPVRKGEWRTTRAFSLAGMIWLFWCLVYVAQIVSRTDQAWSAGDLPRFAIGVGLVTTATVFLLVSGLRRARTRLELAIDDVGVFAAGWGGVVPWSAIDFVLAARLEDDSMGFVLKPEAFAELPDFVRRRNGFLDLNLAATSLTASAALEALTAAYPALEVRRSRSAGLVLPVRGATDIVEADL